MIPTARQKVLNYIVEQRSTTVEELSKVFRVTPANIRHHLAILTRQGSVQVIGTRSSIHKGRPVKIYCSRQELERNNLEFLSDALLCTLTNSSLQKENRYIGQIVDQMRSRFKIDLTNPTRRLYSAIQALNRMNYLAHWEAHIENPRIMLGHCPYQPILENHPELCAVDKLLLENLVGSPVRLVERQTTSPNGLPQCIFLINFRSN